MEQQVDAAPVLAGGRPDGLLRAAEKSRWHAPQAVDLSPLLMSDRVNEDGSERGCEGWLGCGDPGDDLSELRLVTRPADGTQQSRRLARPRHRLTLREKVATLLPRSLSRTVALRDKQKRRT
ncbi:MAG: hypothetical protein M3R46_07640 [Actinomycetota bacterium]|nr:hypothetical protein [Actinomycetota bacterium]